MMTTTVCYDTNSDVIAALERCCSMLCGGEPNEYVVYKYVICIENKTVRFQVRGSRNGTFSKHLIAHCRGHTPRSPHRDS